MERFPNLVYYDNSTLQFYLYGDIFITKEFEKWVKALNHNSGIKQIETIEDLEKFYVKRPDVHKKVLVLGIFYDKFEYEEDIKRFEMAYFDYLKAWGDEVEFGVMTDRLLIEAVYRQKHLKEFLSSDNLYSVISIRRAGVYSTLDINTNYNHNKKSDGQDSLTGQLVRKAVPLFPEMTMKLFEELSKSNKPIFLVIVN